MKLTTRQLDSWLIKGFDGFIPLILSRATEPGVPENIKLGIAKLYTALGSLENENPMPNEDMLLDNAIAAMTCFVQQRAALGKYTPSLQGAVIEASLKLMKALERVHAT